MIQTWLLFSDPHIPTHDKRAWDLTLSVGKALKPYGIACLGDLADLGSVSRHLKDPTKQASFTQELAAVKRELDRLDALKATRKVWVKGNHEARLDTYLKEYAPELVGSLSLEEKLETDKRGWEVVQYRNHTKIGKVYLTHDVGNAGRQAVFKTLEAFEHSVLSAHTHRISYVVEGNAVGEYKVAASFGWLGDVKQIDYMYRVKAMKDWALGFGVGYHNTETGIVHVVPVPIVKYTAVVEGKLYRG